MSVFRFAKVIASLPGTLVANTIYAIRRGIGYDLLISDATGTIAHKLNFNPNATMYEFTFGTTACRRAKFVITDAAITVNSFVVVRQSGLGATGRKNDENEFATIHFSVVPQDGQCTVFAECLNGTAKGAYRIHYHVGDAIWLS